ncbi:MAG TPA: hypothetical protein VF107_05245 [Burkholderiaceae bacterium]
MGLKIFSGIVAVVLFIAFVAPVALKLKETSLIVVIALGVVMMAIDLAQSLRARDD